jgi:beta-glucosidase
VGKSGWVVEPGRFDLWVATSSMNGEKHMFELV